MLIATVDDGALIITPASGSPFVCRDVARIIELCNDPSQPAHKVKAADGGEVAAAARGIWRAIVAAGEEEPKA